MKKRIKLLIALLILSLVFVGCQSAQSNEAEEVETAEETTATETEEVAEEPKEALEGTVYEGVGAGRNGDVTVAVTLGDDNEILALELAEHEETDGFWENAYEELSKQIIDEQTLDVEAVSGATLTSHAILEGTAAALEEANVDVAALGYVPPQLPDPSELIVETGADVVGVRNFEYTTQGNTCSTKITFRVREDDMTVENLVLYNGCDGNARGFCALADGSHIDDVIERFEGIPCHKSDGSSCPDQLAKALDEARFIMQGERLLAQN